MKTDGNTYLKKHPYKMRRCTMMEVQSMKDNASIIVDGTPDPMFNQSITVFNLVKIN